MGDILLENQNNLITEGGVTVILDGNEVVIYPVSRIAYPYGDFKVSLAFVGDKISYNNSDNRIQYVRGL
jgi:hypothetical protein